MDELTPAQPPAPGTRVRFGPDLRVTALIFGAALVALVFAITSDDAPGRLLFGGAALVLAGYAVGDVVCWPRLAADATGVQIRTPLARADVAWVDIESVTADTRNRYGLRSSTLEVDAGETLVVFSRRALGADPTTVQDVVRALDPRPR